eukprot:CAMPEP_0181315520 /NCGR_PEP_ID=MMETSP1101-20121128/15423_1 /TAXON_ID=46948 /ORGANISM="Rhodomonas abbreviata, Strain Caron Lab Isolate" /LENGTH=605 /DNA_ID=CAMNT_0023422741 /DNA_START=36 /DNA_END=1853 /DNA_ORIENTATION=+
MTGRVMVWRALLALALCASVADTFKFMVNWKVPTLDAMRAQRIADEKFGDKKLVVVTGTSSGLGRKTAQALLRTGQYHVVGAVRDLDKMELVAELDGFDPENFTPMHVELANFTSVRDFCDRLKDFKAAKPIDRLICNAAVYQPSLPYAKWSVDGHEQQMQINYLSHFLLVSLLLEEIAKAPDPRVVLVGSVTGNDNTVGGGGVYPIADLKELDGLKLGAKNPISMFDGYNFDGAKAYKDSKLCLMMTSNILHDKYHKQTGIAFSSIYPGCIAESPLFREKRPWFRKNFPIFMKYITGGFVGEEEAGMRLFQVAHDPRCSKSGVYWSWNGGPREGRGEEALEKDGQILGGGGAGGGWDSIYENDQSDKVLNKELAQELFKYSSIVTGAEWPPANQPKSPCPTLKVVGAFTSAMNAKEEAKRMAQKPGMVAGLPGQLTAGSVSIADEIVAATLGAAAKTAQRVFLGELPEEAMKGAEAKNAAKDPLWRRVIGRPSLSEAEVEMYSKQPKWRRFFRKPAAGTAPVAAAPITGSATEETQYASAAAIGAEAKVDAMDPNKSDEEVEDMSIAASKAEMELLRAQLAEKRGLTKPNNDKQEDGGKQKVAA